MWTTRASRGIKAIARSLEWPERTTVGKVYKRKRRSCAMCKPHKMGWSPKRTDKERELCKVHEAEMREAK